MEFWAEGMIPNMLTNIEGISICSLNKIDLSEIRATPTCVFFQILHCRLKCVAPAVLQFFVFSSFKIGLLN